MEAHGMGCLHLLLDALNQLIDVRCRRSTGIDDEIGVEGGDFRATDAAALEAETFDQPACFQGFRIAKHAATTGLCVGLSAGAMAEVAAGDAGDFIRVMAGVKAEPGGAMYYPEITDWSAYNKMTNPNPR